LPSWGPWFELIDETDWPADYGIYRARMSDAAGNPLTLNRLCGADREGIIYIGRSGYLEGKTQRTLGQRLYEFYFEGPHSGGWTYWQAKQLFQAHDLFAEHRLFASVIVLPGTKAEIVPAEMWALRVYFDTFAELPPFNSAFPGKLKTFQKRERGS
jgi:hypothetical protein